MDDENAFAIAGKSTKTIFLNSKKGDLVDYSALWQIIKHTEFKDKIPSTPDPVPAFSFS